MSAQSKMRRLLPPPASPARNPALAEHARRRSQDLNARIADTVTRFAGSMLFVYVHLLWFTLWIALGVEDFPYGLLTMIVSLEAILLTTFVMISQNRTDEKRQLLADQQWQLVKAEEAQNEQLIATSEEILALTRALHAATVPTDRRTLTHEDEARDVPSERSHDG